MTIFFVIKFPEIDVMKNILCPAVLVSPSSPTPFDTKTFRFTWACPRMHNFYLHMCLFIMHKRIWDLNVRARWNMVQVALEKNWDVRTCYAPLSNCRIRRAKSGSIRIVLSVSLNSCLYARGMPMMHEYIIMESTRGCMSMFLKISINL